MLNKLKVMSSLIILITVLSFTYGQHFVPAYLEYSENPYLGMNFYITSAMLDGVDLETGDEIGVFDGFTCVGSGIVDGTISSPNDMLVFEASYQDPVWPAGTGFGDGNAISYHFWDESASIEVVQVTPTYLQGEGIFAFQGTVATSLSGISCESGGQVTCSDGTCADTADDCPTEGIPGCTDDTACNYNAEATVDDGNCEFTDGICESCENGVITDNDADDDGTCDANETVGCMDDTACNYNAEAEFDDGSCLENDCAGECGGSAEEDVCGECGGAETDPTNCLAIDESIMPDEYSITTIYPNPFNPITNISYSLPEYTYVKMEVFDISGKKVQSLINEFQTQGYYNVNWDASSQPSGVYFVKMIANGTINTKKLLLVK